MSTNELSSRRTCTITSAKILLLCKHGGTRVGPLLCEPSVFTPKYPDWSFCDEASQYYFD